MARCDWQAGPRHQDQTAQSRNLRRLRARVCGCENVRWTCGRDRPLQCTSGQNRRNVRPALLVILAAVGSCWLLPVPAWQACSSPDGAGGPARWASVRRSAPGRGDLVRRLSCRESPALRRGWCCRCRRRLLALRVFVTTVPRPVSRVIATSRWTDPRCCRRPLRPVVVGHNRPDCRDRPGRGRRAHESRRSFRAAPDAVVRFGPRTGACGPCHCPDCIRRRAADRGSLSAGACGGCSTCRPASIPETC